MWRHTLQIQDDHSEILVDTQLLGRLGELVAARFHGSGEKILEKTLLEKILIVTDDHVASLYLKPVEDSLSRAGFATSACEVPAGEASKSLACAERIYDALSVSEIGRDGIILALGGGMVSDLAGFAAATWKRGTRFAICSTTLEAALDAAIGGKTAVNLPAGKNLVGAFHTPALVAIDPACLQTLDPRDVRAGLAESIKHALIADEAFLHWHERHAEAILSLDDAVLAELIARNIEIKSDIVSRDPFERTGERSALNLGHTIGHAIEQRAAGILRHGECVALGMLAACRLSVDLGLLEASVVARVEQLHRRLELPTQLEPVYEAGDILEAIRQDKKVRQGHVQFVLLEAIGRPVLRGDITEAQIRAAYETLAK